MGTDVGDEVSFNRFNRELVIQSSSQMDRGTRHHYRSLEKEREKENQAQTGNYHRGDNPRGPLGRGFEKGSKPQGYHSHLALKKRPSYGINQLENIKLIDTYREQFLSFDDLPSWGFLSRHEVTCAFRAKMVDWMIEVTSSFRCSDRTFFKTVELMDSYYSHSQKVERSNDLHLVGVTCILIANKMEEICPLKIRMIHDKIAHRKLSILQITNKEAEVFQTLDYNVNVHSLFDRVESLLALLCLEDKDFDKLEQLASHVTKMVVYDYSLLSSFSKEPLAASIIHLVLRLAQTLLPKFESGRHLDVLKEEMGATKGVLMECAEAVLRVVKNFESLYPQLVSFRRFNRLVIEGRSVKNVL